MDENEQKYENDLRNAATILAGLLSTNEGFAKVYNSSNGKDLPATLAEWHKNISESLIRA